MAVEDDDYRRLFAESFDALFVCLPNFLAARATVAALEKGLHVFCEKPAGRDLDDIASIQRLQRDRPGQRVMFGFNHRHHGSVRCARDRIASGVLGAVTSLHGVYTKTSMSGWRTDRRQAGGGILLDQGVHMLDLFRLFGGEFVTCQSRIRSLGKTDVEDDARALLETDAGVVATLHSSAVASGHRFRLDIGLERGEVSLDGILSGTMNYAPERLIIRGADAHEELFEEDHSFAHEVSAFLEAILNPGAALSGGVDDARAAMDLVYRLYCADESWKNQYDLRNVPREPWI